MGSMQKTIVLEYLAREIRSGGFAETTTAIVAPDTSISVHFGCQSIFAVTPLVYCRSPGWVGGFYPQPGSAHRCIIDALIPREDHLS